MPYHVKPLAFDPGRLTNLSEKLIVSHWENNYGGAVKRLNAIEQCLAKLSWSTAPVFEINGLKREEMIASSSMILHEVYFDSLGGTGSVPNGALLAAIERDFGAVDAWCDEFKAVAKAQGGGSGWTLLVWSPHRRRVVNAWASDHSFNLAGATPLIALDMYEHSYHMDFGAKAGAYVDAFMQNLSWTSAEIQFAKVSAEV